jgi:hypothetical protein
VKQPARPLRALRGAIAGETRGKCGENAGRTRGERGETRANTGECGGLRVGCLSGVQPVEGCGWFLGTFSCIVPSDGPNVADKTAGLLAESVTYAGEKRGQRGDTSCGCSATHQRVGRGATGNPEIETLRLFPGFPLPDEDSATARYFSRPPDVSAFSLMFSLMLLEVR